MKILIFNWRDVKNPKSGGAEVLTHQVARRWAEQGHQIVLFSSSFRGAKKEEILDDVKIVRAGNALSVYWHAYRYYRKFFTGKFDIIIDEINTVPFFSVLYAKEPVICHINQLAKEVWFYESCLPVAILGYLLEPLVLRFYKNGWVITISESTKEDLLKLGFKKEKIFTIPMGIDFKALETISEKEKEPTLIYVGRLKKSKRVHQVIEAFKLAKQRIPTCKLWIVGDGDGWYKKKLYRMAKDNSSINFFHSINDDDKLNLMKKAHILLITSIREGWGLVVTEANAMGTPAIGYRVPGLKDSIQDKVNGLLCNNNNPDELSRLIIDILSDKKRYLEFAKRALESSRKYHWDATAHMTLEAVSKILTFKKV